MGEAFQFQFPAWIVCHPQHGPSSVTHTRLEDGRVILAIFTDEDLAERYLRDAGAPPDFAALAIDGRELDRLLAFVEQEDKVTHVTIDPDQYRRSRWGFPIGEFRDDLRRWLEDHDQG